MDILTRFEFHSKVVPGVVATFRRPSVATRERFLEAMGPARARVRELRRKWKPLSEEYDAALAKAKAAAKVLVDSLIENENLTRADAEARVLVTVDFPDEKLEALNDLTDEMERLQRQAVNRGALRALLASVEGYTLDGKHPSAEDLIENAPMALTDELAKAAGEIAELSPTERGESPWPGTSAKAEAGPDPSTTAPSAESAPEQS